MHVDKQLYFLQPQSDQAISTVRLLKKSSNIYVNAVLLRHEKKLKFLNKLYDNVITIDSYDDLEPGVVLVPFGAKSTEYLLNRGNIKLNKVLMSQSVLNVYDKPYFLDFCEHNDLPIPRTYLDDKKVRYSDFPIFYKQKFEQGGGVRGVAYSKAELPITSKESLIYQEFIKTEGTYGVGFIADQGQLLTSFCHFEELSYPASGGSAIVVKTIHNNRLKELTEKFVKLSNYSGWGLAEFKWCDKKQDFIFMEVNAKFWASCELAFRNEPEFIERLFGITCSKEKIDGLIFINRALGTGVLKGLNIMSHYNSLPKVVYPRLLLPIIKNLIPERAVLLIKKAL